MWTVRSSPFVFASGVAWTGTVWVATGGNGGAMTSPTGTVWTAASAAFPQGTFVAARTPVFPPL
jgi:nicotinamide mononucleotide (NMN) deamidase PncC